MNEIIHVFSKYDESGASSRVRLYSARDFFEHIGLHLRFHPLLTASYMQRRLSGYRISPLQVGAGMLHRWRFLTGLLQDDTPWLWVEYELFPWFPVWMESWVFRKARVVLDFDDAVFHRYDQHTSWWVRKILGSKICSLIQKAFAVTVCNAYLETYARQCGASRVIRYPSCVDLKRYHLKPSRYSAGPMVVGWMGSPSTSWYLLDLVDVVRELKGESIRWLFVGTDPRIRQYFEGLPVEFVDWSLEQEVTLLHRMDVGIMPLPDTPWARGKCGYKLIQYMAVGIPVIASPVGINTELARSGETGFLAISHKDWVDALRGLLHNPELRRKLGMGGRHLVENQFDLAKNATQLAHTFSQWME